MQTWWSMISTDILIDWKKGRRRFFFLISMMWRWWVLVMLTDWSDFWTNISRFPEGSQSYYLSEITQSIDRSFVHGGFNIIIKILRRIDGWWCGGGGLFGGGCDEQVLVVVVVDLLNNCTTIWTNDEILVVVVAVEISLAAMHNMKLESSCRLWL